MSDIVALQHEIIPRWASFDESVFYVLEHVEENYQEMMRGFALDELGYVAEAKELKPDSESRIKQIKETVIQFIKKRVEDFMAMCNKFLQDAKKLIAKAADKNLNKMAYKIKENVDNLKDKEYGKTFAYPNFYKYVDGKGKNVDELQAAFELCGAISDAILQNDIADMEKRFNFLGQVALPADSFSATGVISYDTKIQYWQRKSEADTETKPYKKEMSFTVLKNGNYDEIAAWIKENILSSAQSELRKNRYGILREIAKDGTLSSEFEYRVKSMLYQVKCHPKLKEHYNKCSEYLYRFAHQEKSADMDYKEWCKKRITEAKVIAYLKNVIKKQSAPPAQDRTALVKQKYCFVYKGYSPKAVKTLSEEQKKPIHMYDIVTGSCFDEFPGYEKLIRRKQNEYIVQSQPFADMTEDSEISEWLNAFSLWDAENEEEIRLTISNGGNICGYSRN